MTPLHEFVSQYSTACIRRFFESYACWTVLATGHVTVLGEWGVSANADYFDMRGSTIRCRLWITPPETDLDVLTRAAKAAREHDVTLQLLCVYEPLENTARRIAVGDCTARVRLNREEYPVVHLGTHGMRWADQKDAENE